jgi:hypothetical protein
MKTYPLSKQYKISKIENEGRHVEISIEQEGIREQDFVFLTDHPSLNTAKYEVVKIRSKNGLLYADLVRIPEEPIEL